MTAIFWHELSQDQKREITGSDITIGEFMQKYRQPAWCSYPEALRGVLGCWSLVDCDIVVDEDFCQSCECYRK